MTIEKLDNDYTSLGIIRNKINEIIDHLNSKEVFPDTGKMIESKQELIPLDMERICDEIRSIAAPKTWEDVSPNNQLKTILSKYRVSPTPPVTSTIEEQINQIENIIRNGGWAYGADILTVKGEKGLKQLLSSLSPIQKKRSEVEITEYCKKKGYGLQDLCAISQFIQDNDLLQE